MTFSSMTTLSLLESFVYSFGYMLSLIPYREEIMRGVEGPIKMPRKNKRRHDGKVRKKECDIGDKMQG